MPITLPFGLETGELGIEELELGDLVGESDDGGLLELLGVPDGFGRVFAYGLGLRRPYRGIIHAIEDLTDCRTVAFGTWQREGAVGPTFRLNLSRFAEFRKSVDRNRNRGNAVVRRVNLADAHNAINDVLGGERVVPELGRIPIIRGMTRGVAGDVVFDAEDGRVLVRETVAHTRRIAAESPKEFGVLRRDVELVSLEVLIEQFSSALDGKRSNDEGYWQGFFEKNPFALQQLFAAPVALYGEQLSVRGSNARGRGARIADFMLVNTVTKTAHVVEIKAPSTKLLRSAPYRGTDGSEVFVPHNELLGAIAQVQAQMESTVVDLPDLLRRTPGSNELSTVSVRGAVLVGSTSALTSEQRDSFIRFRDGLAGVKVMTFDEVRDRLQGLHDLLVETADHESQRDTS